MKKIKVIVCDDHTLLRTGVRDSLRKREEIDVIAEAENGLMLLRLLRTLSPDIIILNIAMPVMDGMQTLPILKIAFPDIKVIILSMHNDKNIIYDMMELGANSYLTKEVGSEEIYQTILTCQEIGYCFNKTVIDAVLHRVRNGKPLNHRVRDLSNTEKDILLSLQKEHDIPQIAADFDLSIWIVQAIIERLKSRLNVQCIPTLIRAAFHKEVVLPQ